MEWRYHAPDGKAAIAARRAFVRYLHLSCTPESDVTAAEIVFGELVSNAVRYAPGPVEIAVQCDSCGLVTLEVCDTGPGFTFADTPPSLQSESGRGLYIVSRLCARLETLRTPVGNCVKALLPVVAAAARAPVP